MKLPTMDSAMSALKTMSDIVLGNNKDGTPRSLFDAKIQFEKQRAKTEKQRLKRAKKMLRNWRRD